MQGAHIDSFDSLIREEGGNSRSKLYVHCNLTIGGCDEFGS